MEWFQVMNKWTRTCLIFLRLLLHQTSRRLTNSIVDIPVLTYLTKLTNNNNNNSCLSLLKNAQKECKKESKLFEDYKHLQALNDKSAGWSLLHETCKHISRNCGSVFQNSTKHNWKEWTALSKPYTAQKILNNPQNHIFSSQNWFHVTNSSVCKYPVSPFSVELFTCIAFAVLHVSATQIIL